MFAILPASNAAENTGTAQATNPASRGQGQLILMVDDDIYTLRMLGRILEQSGYKTLPALNGFEALAAFDKQDSQKIELVITDLAMPGMNGIELIQALRAIDPRQPILIITGQASSHLSEKERQIIGDPELILLKPLNPPRLLEEVRRRILPG